MFVSLLFCRFWSICHQIMFIGCWVCFIHWSNSLKIRKDNEVQETIRTNLQLLEERRPKPEGFRRNHYLFDMSHLSVVFNSFDSVDAWIGLDDLVIINLVKLDKSGNDLLLDLDILRRIVCNIGILGFGSRVWLWVWKSIVYSLSREVIYEWRNPKLELMSDQPWVSDYWLYRQHRQGFKALLASNLDYHFRMCALIFISNEHLLSKQTSDESFNLWRQWITIMTLVHFLALVDVLDRFEGERTFDSRTCNPRDWSASHPITMEGLLMSSFDFDRALCSTSWGIFDRFLDRPGMRLPNVLYTPFPSLVCVLFRPLSFFRASSYSFSILTRVRSL